MLLVCPHPMVLPSTDTARRRIGYSVYVSLLGEVSRTQTEASASRGPALARDRIGGRHPGLRSPARLGAFLGRLSDRRRVRTR